LENIFPMIGKIFRAFSNDWKNFQDVFGKQKGERGTTKQGENKGCQTIMTIPDNGVLHGTSGTNRNLVGIPCVLDSCPPKSTCLARFGTNHHVRTYQPPERLLPRAAAIKEEGPSNP
jgi:hypothetical protein